LFRFCESAGNNRALRQPLYPSRAGGIIMTGAQRWGSTFPVP
jgi:hypothetical protein